MYPKGDKSNLKFIPKLFSFMIEPKVMHEVGINSDVLCKGVNSS